MCSGVLCMTDTSRCEHLVHTTLVKVVTRPLLRTIQVAVSLDAACLMMVLGSNVMLETGHVLWCTPYDQYTRTHSHQYAIVELSLRPRSGAFVSRNNNLK